MSLGAGLTLIVLDAINEYKKHSLLEDSIDIGIDIDEVVGETLEEKAQRIRTLIEKDRQDNFFNN